MQALAPQKRRSPASDSGALRAYIQGLTNMSLNELRVAWRYEFRRTPPSGFYRDLLIRTLSWRLQENAHGGHSNAILKLLDRATRTNGGTQLFHRLKPGTVLVREYRNVRHTVTITPEGYLWQDRTYDNLTAIACTITGTQWNGPRFFGLRKAAP
jgi:hypothetical protein